MAELIIGKNRHGPVGSVNFTYRKEFALFVNYTPLEFNNYQTAAIQDPGADAAFKEFSPS